MKVNIFIVLVLLSMISNGQQVVDPSQLPFLPYKPSISGVNSQNEISIAVVFAQGLKVILDDKTYKVIQFDVVYDCHSRSIFDFTVKRYVGDKVDAKDEFMRKRILAGDLMDIVNTVIEKDGVRYRMKEFSFIVIN